MKIKSTQDLRAFLLNQIDKVSSGAQAVSQAKAICNYSQQIYNTINIELKCAAAEAKISNLKRAPIQLLGESDDE